VTTNINYHSLEDKDNLTFTLPVNEMRDTNSVLLKNIKNL